MNASRAADQDIVARPTFQVTMVRPPSLRTSFPGPPPQRIGLIANDQPIVACATDDVIGSRPSRKVVVAITSDQIVVHRSPEQAIVAATSKGDVHVPVDTGVLVRTLIADIELIIIEGLQNGVDRPGMAVVVMGVPVHLIGSVRAKPSWQSAAPARPRNSIDGSMVPIR